MFKVLFEVGVCILIGSCSIFVCRLWNVVGLIVVKLLLLLTNIVVGTYVLAILCKVVLENFKIKISVRW